ncbi:MAG: glycosyltransferase family 2 protein [Alphaproteobacteria bacterium]
MLNGQTISVIIPAFNEERAIENVITAIPDLVDQVIVADNNSSDRTAAISTALGATVVSASKQGYGSACLAGIAYLEQGKQPDILVFLDGDFADDPSYLPALVAPIANGTVDMVIGSRKAKAIKGSLTFTQKFGNWLSCFLIKLIWRKTYTDLGPFRAIRWSALEKLSMKDPDYGWTVEMQIKAAKLGLETDEIDVPYIQRIGTSKISGTLKGTVLAGSKILYLIAHSAVFKS